MNALNFLEANVWLALLWNRHMHSEIKEFRARSRFSTRSPKIWADAYLLAFAAVAGANVVTFDRALQSRGAEVLVL